VTTTFNFQPSVVQPFQFSPVLDGQTYTAIITWNLFRGPNNATQGYFLNLYSLDGTLIVCRALVGSDVGLTVQSLAWANGIVTVTTSEPHGYKIGKTLSLTLNGATPTGFNGLQSMLVTGPNTLTFPLSTNPGVPTAFGAVSFDVSMTSGYFSSTLVYRTANSQFEVNP
jgi:hypothetical protein